MLSFVKLFIVKLCYIPIHVNISKSFILSPQTIIKNSQNHSQGFNESDKNLIKR